MSSLSLIICNHNMVTFFLWRYLPCQITKGRDPGFCLLFLLWNDSDTGCVPRDPPGMEECVRSPGSGREALPPEWSPSLWDSGCWPKELTQRKKSEGYVTSFAALDNKNWISLLVSWLHYYATVKVFVTWNLLLILQYLDIWKPRRQMPIV